MQTVALLLIAVLGPTGLGYGVLVVRRFVAASNARRPPLPETPIERIGADLRRLHDLLDRTENASSDLPSKNMRCRATRAAYADALGDACRRLEVSFPATRPVSRAEIYRAEADLRRRGLDVRPAI